MKCALKCSHEQECPISLTSRETGEPFSWKKSPWPLVPKGVWAWGKKPINVFAKWKLRQIYEVPGCVWQVVGAQRVFVFKVCSHSVVSDSLCLHVSSPTLAHGFFTTGPPGKPYIYVYIYIACISSKRSPMQEENRYNLT